VNDHAQQVAEIRRSLVDPTCVVEWLGLGDGAQRQSSGLSIRCPVHAEKTPSCSVTRGPDGTLRVKCFGCDWTGDVLSLVAAVRGLDTRRDFREVLIAAAEMGGLHQLADELRGAARRMKRELPSLPEPEPCKDYPPEGEALAVWQSAKPVQEDEPCQIALALRGLFPGPELARSVAGATLAQWARYGGQSWADTGHRIVLPAFDADGALRSLRAWQVIRNASGPKRLPPAGYRATGLVLANGRALQHLRAPAAPIRLIVCEGEPDFLSLCQMYATTAVIGLWSGSWSQTFADRVPFGSVISIRTHNDPAGQRYADTVRKTLTGRALIKRGV
jgi:hypothetical protein